MLIVVVNKSRKRKFLQTKKLFSSVLFPVTKRIHVGDLPVRVIIQLIKDTKKISSRGMNVKFFIESKKIGYMGFKCIEVGKKESYYDRVVNAVSRIDKKLIKEKIINPLFFS